ncbi:hypothetical protein [Nitrosovibrio sp. Nv17]|uniref:hypothetical protein n=1 Tax=Nitrosovibrio sp. Nv17 TaxID=1855339 RepID=UPI000908D745|nr:hypothetical protein [Nitrosovibrio sp. Nv17]SFW13224.1 hypothetical protein SAMN05216414_10229 [Nitrosovibrio sp. Nv17]
MIFRSLLVAMLCLGIAALAAFPAASGAQEAEDFSSSLRAPRPENRTRQKESFSSGACVVETGAFPVGFNAYVVPDGDHPSYPPFCSPVPAGPLNIVMDLFAPEIREVPLTVRLMKVEGGDEREVLVVPAQAYGSGNIALAVDLEPLAKYNLLIIGDDEAGRPETLVTIPLEVRRAGDFVHSGKGTGWGFLVMVVALAGLVGGAIHKWNPKKPAA